MNRQQKAANTKAERAAARVWEDVEKKKAAFGCSCALRKGMSYEDLRPLRGGCTDTPTRSFAGKSSGGRFVCPVLDLYRRSVPNPPPEEIAA